MIDHNLNCRGDQRAIAVTGAIDVTDFSVPIVNPELIEKMEFGAFSVKA